MGPDRARIHAEEVRSVYSAAPLNMVATLVNSFLLACVLWQDVSFFRILAWLGANLVLAGGRYLLVFRYRKTGARPDEAKRWGKRFLLGIGATGILWGAGGYVLFPADSVFHQALLLLVFGGMIAGVVGAYSVLKSVVPVYTLPLILPVTVRLLTQETELQSGVAILLIMFLVLMLWNSRRIRDVMSASILRQFLNQELTDRLRCEKESAEELNELLKAQIQERWKAEKELQEARAGVEQRILERTEELRQANERLAEEIRARERAVEEKDRVFNLSRDLIAVAGMDGYFKLVNPAWERTLGYSQEELLARPLLDFILPDDHEKNRKEVERLAAGLPTEDFENRYLHRDGSFRVISWTAAPVPEERLLFCVGRDVTRRRRYEESLRKMARDAVDLVRLKPDQDVYAFIAERLRDLLPDTVVAVNSFDPESGTLVTRSILGLDPPMLDKVGNLIGEQTLGATFREIEEEIRDKLFSGRLQEVEEGLYGIFFGRVPADRCREIEDLVGVRGTYSIGFRWGGTLFGNASLFCQRDEPLDREIVETFVNQASIVLDRRKAEAAVRTAAEEWQKTFDSISDAVSLVDAEGTVLRCNRAMSELVGRPVEDAVGRRCWELVHKTSERIDGCPVVRMKISRKKESLILPMEGRILEVSVDPILDARGDVAGAVHIVTDITEKRRMEDEVLRARKLESVGILAGGIAHDFNNLLAVIWGNVSLAKISLSPGTPGYQNLEQAEKGAGRARDLSQQLLTFSSGGAPVRKSADIAGLLRDVAGSVLRGSAVKSDLDLPHDLWPAEIDEAQIRQVFRHLLLNALQAMPGGGKVRVGAENVRVQATEDLPLPPGRYVKIAVEDDGTGIPGENLSKIFDPYFTTREQGNGLGLAVVYSIVTKHEGFIRVESEPGRGAVFTVFLPASETERPRKGPVRDAAAGGGVRILVMDDEEMVLEVVGQMLSHLGYQADLARDGEDAIRLYRAALAAGTPYHAAILDLTVPGGMGGRETVRRLREIDPGVRAVVSSGYSSDPILAEYEAYGFSETIPKPFSMVNLSRVLRKILA
jgi:PAS domain S-box-containing protein